MGQQVWKPLLLMLVLIIVFDLLYSGISQQTLRQGAEISYSRFREELAADNVKSVSIKGGALKGSFRTKAKIVAVQEGKEVSRDVTDFSTVLPPLADPTLMPELIVKKVEVTAVSTESSPLMSALIYILPWLLIIGVWWLMMRGAKGQGPGAMIGGFAKSGARMYSDEKQKVTFDDVAGMETSKQELKE
ncbi:MAG TPA: ATP-dependent metallopeptidase FtsH/Yme1/Tma family protein, partial [Geobacteraceae bacterium]